MSDTGTLSAPLPLLRDAVEARLDEVISEHRARLQELGAASEEMLHAATLALQGGKRMRAILGAVGMSVPRGTLSRRDCILSAQATHLGAALEFYQASALVHDDVMDGALTRRGLPASHRVFAATHEQSNWLGRAKDFGVSGAILLGDLLLSWAGQEMSALEFALESSRQGATEAGAAGSALPASSQAAAVRRARLAFGAMTAEVAMGQFLDVRSEVTPLPLEADPQDSGAQMHQDALAVIRHKSARYSVQHPLLIGALLAGIAPTSPAFEHLAVFGEEIGIAFQLRDDDLGVFGDPARTGKPAGDDLREGKRTVLLALSWSRSDAAGRNLLSQVLANREASAAQITAAAQVIERCGARQAHEEAIATHRQLGERALAALAQDPSVDPQAVADLEHLALILTERQA